MLRLEKAWKHVQQKVGVTAFPKKEGHAGKGRGRDTGARTQSANSVILLKGCLSDYAGDQREMSLDHKGHSISD